MFQHVRRNPKQELSPERSLAILEKATSGVLNVLGDDGYPYGVPMSYRLKDNRLYFHCAQKGHKIDAIKSHPQVSFTVIETDQIVPEEYTTYFRSVIVFGKAQIIETPEEKRKALSLLIEKYSPDFIEGSAKEIDQNLDAVCIFTVNIEHITGKEAIEFAEGK